MKAILLIAVAICVIGSALAVNPPALPQQFTANFTVIFPDYVSPLTSLIDIGGMTAFDWVNGGLFIELGGEEFVPVSFHTNMVVSPGQGVLTPYVYEGPLCWQYGAMPSVLLKYFPFQIPSNATFLGNQVINNEACTGWQFEVNFFNIITLATPVTLWTSTVDGSIVQLDIKDVNYAGVNEVQVNFFNRVTGPLSPSTYAPPTKANPKLDCKFIQL